MSWRCTASGDCPAIKFLIPCGCEGFQPTCKETCGWRRNGGAARAGADYLQAARRRCDAQFRQGSGRGVAAPGDQRGDVPLLAQPVRRHEGRRVAALRPAFTPWELRPQNRAGPLLEAFASRLRPILVPVALADDWVWATVACLSRSSSLPRPFRPAFRSRRPIRRSAPPPAAARPPRAAACF
jgi:hypothetical protein